MPLPENVKEWFWPGTKEAAGDKKERLDIQNLLLGVQQGQRNDICAKLAGYYLRLTKGDTGQTKAILSAWNDRNQPPLDWKEVERTVDSIGKRHQQEEIKEESEASSLFRKIEKLSYPDGEVRYRVWVDGFDGYMDMQSIDLLQRHKFKDKFFQLTDISPKLPKAEKWDDWLTTAMRSAVHITVDEDESPLGLIASILEDAISPGRRCEDITLVNSHVVFEEAEGKQLIYFNMKYITDSLFAYGMKLETRKIGQLLRRIGCRKIRKTCNGISYGVWEKCLKQ
jgi:hypothetical protein